MASTPSDSTDKNFHWYVIQVGPNMENQAIIQMDEMIEKHQLQCHFGRKLMPTEEVVQLRNGRKKKVTKKLYHGYLFIQIHELEHVYKQILALKAVRGFLDKTQPLPKPIPASQMDAILKVDQQQENQVHKSSGLFTVGEHLHVGSGPFRGFDGPVLSYDDEREKLKISVTMFGESTEVELSYDDIQEDK